MQTHMRSRIRGVSLIEMLIVVAIIGVLIALLIPAIQAVRNSAKKVQNQNNMKQILLAFQHYISQNDGKLPQETVLGYYDNNGYYNRGWSETCYCNYFGPPGCYKGASTQSGGVITETRTQCPNPFILKQVNTYTVDPNHSWITSLTSSVVTDEPSVARLNWTEGTPFFLILPFMEYENVWNASYGPMTAGAIYQDPAQAAAEGIPAAISSTLNYGWQGGRSPALIKTYAGYGDPTLDFPGLLAPLSYPMLGAPGGYSFGGYSPNPLPVSIENLNSAYQPMITEAYAGCTAGGYNSWAASSVVNLDFNPIPKAPSYSAVNGTSGTNNSIATIWTGIKTPDTQCENLYHGGNRGANSSNACSCTGVTTDPNFPQGMTDLRGNASYSCNLNTQNWNFVWGQMASSRSTLNHVQWSHVSNTTDDYSIGDPTACVPDGWGYSQPECHVGEWFYKMTYKVYNKNFWLDHPNPETAGQNTPMSMVPGSLNIGFLDGSVRSISKNISISAWNAIVAGQAPMDDAENW